MAHVVDPHAFAWLLDGFAKISNKAPFPPRPRPEPAPDFQADLIRPDDLLTLHVAGYNLKPAGKAAPVLERIDAAKDAVLVVTFPPQNIAETAYPASAPTEPPPAKPPGQTAARLSGFTRLAFRIAANAAMPAIPYSIEGLLDWSGFEPAVSALADIPRQPSAGQIAAAPAIAEPGAKETAIELPYRLTLSPNHNFVWRHAKAPVTYSSRTELWHTRLTAKTADGIIELSALNTAPLRAIWSPDYNPARAVDPAQDPQPGAHNPPPLGITDILPNHRHQIVVLTSVFHGYRDDNNAPFVPSPVEAQMLMLSPLGGWLRSRGHWDPPQALRFIPWPPLVFAADLPLVGQTGCSEATEGGRRLDPDAQPARTCPPASAPSSTTDSSSPSGAADDTADHGRHSDSLASSSSCRNGCISRRKAATIMCASSRRDTSTRSDIAPRSSPSPSGSSATSRCPKAARRRSRT